MEIDCKFYHADFEHPKAYTVGELKEILAELPDDLRIKQGFEDGVKLIIYNHGFNPHLELEEIDED